MRCKSPAEAMLHYALVKIPSRTTSCKIESGCSSVAYGIGAKAALLVVRSSGSPPVPPALSLLMENLRRRQRAMA
jgi:hypothetical protein